MKRTLDKLADYIYGLLQSNLTNFGTNIHDAQGIKYQLPCNAFILIKKSEAPGAILTMHQALIPYYTGMYYCIGTVTDDVYFKICIHTIDQAHPNITNSDVNELLKDGNSHIKDDLYEQCGIRRDEGNVQQYVPFLTPAHQESKDLAEKNCRIVKSHFVRLAKFAAPAEYNDLQGRKRDSEGAQRVQCLTSDELIPLVDKLIEGHKLSQYGEQKIREFLSLPITS